MQHVVAKVEAVEAMKAVVDNVNSNSAMVVVEAATEAGAAEAIGLHILLAIDFVHNIGKRQLF